MTKNIRKWVNGKNPILKFSAIRTSFMLVKIGKKNSLLHPQAFQRDIICSVSPDEWVIR